MTIIRDTITIAMSSFRKTVKIDKSIGESHLQNSPAIYHGIKPWIHGGSSVVSFGSRQLDEIFSGGHVLGSCVMVESDDFSDFGLSLLKYEIAEALSMEHQVLLLTTDALWGNQIIESLPYNLNGPHDEIQNKLSETNMPNTMNGEKNSDNLQIDDQPTTQEKHKLQIAWQYGKYLSPGTQSVNIK